MGYKVYISILLWRLGLRQILPSSYVNSRAIRENNSPLVDISGDADFSFGEDVAVRGGLWVRADMVPMLRTAAHSLPNGVKLHFFCGYRHIAVQWTAWERNLKIKRERFPNVSEQKLRQMARLTSADPSRGGFGPHQTGGAIDVTLVRDGNPMDMGAPFGSGQKCRTDDKTITPEQRSNRDILRRALTDAGLINYPGEWWHYSYGDRAWAAYGRKPYAIYGRIDNPDYKLHPSEIPYADK